LRLGPTIPDSDNHLLGMRRGSVSARLFSANGITISAWSEEQLRHPTPEKGAPRRARPRLGVPERIALSRAPGRLHPAPEPRKA
jgi:hypothetical protein